MPVPKLKGTLVEAEPAVPPDGTAGGRAAARCAATAARSEISVKLDAPLTGKPELNSDISVGGCSRRVYRDSFLLTMDTEKAKVEGLKTNSLHGDAGTRTAQEEGLTTPRAGVPIASCHCVHVQQPYIKWLYDWTEPGRTAGGYHGPENAGLKTSYRFSVFSFRLKGPPAKSP